MAKLISFVRFSIVHAQKLHIATQTVIRNRIMYIVQNINANKFPIQMVSTIRLNLFFKGIYGVK